MTFRFVPCRTDPDGGPIGTRGCTGLVGADAEQMRQLIEAFNPSPTNPLPVVVTDTVWGEGVSMRGRS